MGFIFLKKSENQNYKIQNLTKISNNISGVNEK